MKWRRYHYALLRALLLSVLYISTLGDVPTNVALRKKAYIWPERSPSPSVAVDGNLNSNHGSGSCAHSNEGNQNKPWWKVDLDGDYVIRNVKILNRGDCDCYDRLSNFGLYVGFDNITNSNNKLCHYQASAVGQGAWLDAVCPQPIIGRFVVVQILGPSQFRKEQILSICEVQVFATLMPSSFNRNGKLVSKGQRIGEHQIGSKFETRSLLECAKNCWSSHNKLCVTYSLCTYKGTQWCHLGATYDVDSIMNDSGCNTYEVKYEIP